MVHVSEYVVFQDVILGVRLAGSSGTASAKIDVAWQERVTGNRKSPGRPPGRPKRDGHESGRARLLKVAREEFGRNGYAATSVDELVNMADVSSATLYHHFESKMGLFVAAARDAYDRTLSSFRGVVADNASFQEVIQALIDESIVLMRNEPELAMMITTMQFELRRDPELARQLRPALLEFREFFDDVAERAPLELRPTPQGTRDLSHLLVAIVAGLATESMLLSRTEDIQNMFVALRRWMWPGP